MRKTAIVVLIVLLSGASAGIAAAHQARRDPFRPIVTEGAAGTGATAPATGEAATEPATEPPPPSERLADTGGDPYPWLVVAFVLIALGAGAIVVHHMARPSYLVG